MTNLLIKNGREPNQLISTVYKNDFAGYQKNGFEDIRKHPWFKDFEWNQLVDQRCTGPYLENGN